MRGLYKTDIEQIMFDALQKEGIEVATQFPIRCKYGYVLDYAIPGLKICIECDGKHWHLKGNKHDKKRDGYLKSKGWTVLRFTDTEIKENIEQCINKIKNHIPPL